MVEHDLTTEDVASVLRLNKATVQRLLKHGRLRGYQIGRSWRIPQSAVDEFRRQQTSAGSQPKRNVWPTEDIDEWRRLLYDETNLVSVPSIPDSALSRESIYSDHD